jgi:hypothetical protein
MKINNAFFPEETLETHFLVVEINLLNLKPPNYGFLFLHDLALQDFLELNPVSPENIID